MNRAAIFQNSLIGTVLLVLGIQLMGCDSNEERFAERSVSAVEKYRLRLDSENDGVMVVAHRACWRNAPENSIRAVNRCIELGVDMVEIDVRRTRDGHLVVIHDETVDRTTDGKGMVQDLTLAQVSALRLRQGLGGDDAAVTDQRVPTLEQVLNETKGRILVNLDAKGDVRDQAFAVASQLGVTDQILIKMTMTSPSDADLSGFTFFGKTYFMPIVKQDNGDLPLQVRNFVDVDTVAFEVIYEDEERLQAACREAANQGARCWLNTMWESLSPGHSDDISVLDPENHWGHLVRIGVNMIQTDRPAELIEYLDERGYR